MWLELSVAVPAGASRPPERFREGRIGEGGSIIMDKIKDSNFGKGRVGVDCGAKISQVSRMAQPSPWII